MRILDNTKKELEGYLDYQYMVFSPKWGSEKFGFGLCPFAKAIPIYLNEQLQLPEDERILSIKELDEGQVMHKPGKL